MNLSLNTKITATSAIAVALCLSISVFGTWRLQNGLKSFRYIAEVSLENLGSLADMEKAGVLIEASNNLLIGGITTAEDAKIATDKFNAAIAVFDQSVKQYESLKHSGGEEEVWKKFENGFWAQYTNDAKKIIQLSSTGKPEDRAARDKFAATNWKEDVRLREGEFNTLTDFQDNDVKRRSSKADQEAATLAWLIPLLLFSAGILSITIAFLLGRTIAKNLMLVADSIGQSSNQVSSTSIQIATSSEQLSNAVTEQAASLQQTAASLEEISSMVAKASESAETTASSSSQSQNKAENGRSAAHEIMNSMTEISQSTDAIMVQTNHSNAQMAEIIKIIQGIAEKTKVINDIVFQTKLLSFNASVEAARAGEQGKGFSVVAEEVGNLALMSGKAAQEISAILQISIQKVEEIVTESKAKVEHLTSEGKQKVSSGVDKAQQCAEVLNEIVQNVTTVAGLAREISLAGKEQALGVNEINKALSQLEVVTQQNSASSIETAGAAEVLSNHASSLRQAVSDLVRTIKGGSSSEIAQPSESKFDAANGSNIRAFSKNKKREVAALKKAKKNSGSELTPTSEDARFKEV